ncbi:MAG: hypothetical protein ACREDP_15865 [Bradyrhizobium sp.]
MAPFDFHRFWLNLTPLQRAKLARDAETTAGYIQSGLITGRKVPRPELLEKLAPAVRALGGRRAKVENLYLHFHQRYLEATAEPQAAQAHG